MNTCELPSKTARPGTVLSRPPAIQQPRLWRLHACAAMCGLTAETLLTSCQRGQIPVEAVQIGKRGIWYVDAQQFTRWMGSSLPTSNLF